MNTSASNLTINSQQDTSDYVSTLEEDLSIVEWEYQLPAPPSAFRDNASPVFDNFEAITPISESLIDTKTEEAIQTSKNKNLKILRMNLREAILIYKRSNNNDISIFRE